MLDLDMNHLTVLKDYLTVCEAELDKLVLEEAGVPVFLEIHNDNTLFGPERVRLLIHDDQSEKAVQILQTQALAQSSSPDDNSDVVKDEAVVEAYEVSEDVESGVSLCLACGCRLGENEERCAQCGWTYQVDPENVEAGELELEGAGVAFLDQ